MRLPLIALLPLSVLIGVLPATREVPRPETPAAPQEYRGALAGEAGFQFVRIKYEGIRYSRNRTWAFDYPTAEINLHEAIDRTTRIHIDGPPIVLTLDDDRIFEYPILYLTEPGYWQTNEHEVANLQRFFARGGFMLIDDFHDHGGKSGPQWSNFYANIKQVFPDLEPVELPPEHPVWSIYYDIDPVEAPSTKDYEGFGKYDDEYWAFFDEAGRMMVLISYNQDLGDGWEWPSRNFEDASTLSFQMGINFIIYALTH
jgi:hypothetical protein